MIISDKNSVFKECLNKYKLEKRLGIHSFHRYYGKLIPAIPRAAIKEYTKEGDMVFDPFTGSGTTAVEAIYFDRKFLGIEINPLSYYIAQAKTASYDLEYLKYLNEEINKAIDKDKEIVAEKEKPFCINRDHWFKDYVQDDMVRIKRNIEKIINKEGCERETVKLFFLSILSAIVKQVSNADVMHVFPGISKRMRALEAEGKVNVNVVDVYKKAVQKRLGYVSEYGKHKYKPIIINGDSANIDLNEYKDSIDLIVTNPPYISSVRYAETLKLELYWMEICKSSKEYLQLSDLMIGNDHIKKCDYKDKHETKYEFINEYINLLYEIDPKQAKVVYDYFSLMEKVIKNMNFVLKRGKKVVMKISDSNIRKIKVPTGKLLTLLAQKNGFKLIDCFNDKINENSRSLTTARNTYSDIILEDNIIIWEKI